MYCFTSSVARNIIVIFGSDLMTPHTKILIRDARMLMPCEKLTDCINHHSHKLPSLPLAAVFVMLINVHQLNVRVVPS
jgi:hypothetical protein